MKVAIDENVLAVANDIGRVLRGEDPICPQADDACRESCSRFLLDAINNRVILLDSRDVVLSYYRRKASMAGQPGSGDAFLMQLFQSSYNPSRVMRVELSTNGTFDLPETFVESGFDRDDMIYVALCVAAPPAEVVNAVDSDYAEFAAQIAALEVSVMQLCGG